MSGDRLPAPMDRFAPIFVISVAAQLAGMHPQTLRGYDRLGLVSPRRAKGRGRRYSLADIARLRLVGRLSQEEGINLPGIRRILDLQEQLEDREAELAALRARVEAAEAAHAGPRLFAATGTGDVRFASSYPHRALRALTR